MIHIDMNPKQENPVSTITGDRGVLIFELVLIIKIISRDLGISVGSLLGITAKYEKADRQFLDELCNYWTEEKK